MIFLKVVHCASFIISNSSLMLYQDEIDELALIFSALMHDINHTGKNNIFEASTFSDLAIRYND